MWSKCRRRVWKSVNALLLVIELRTLWVTRGHKRVILNSKYQQSVVRTQIPLIWMLLFAVCAAEKQITEMDYFFFLCEGVVAAALMQIKPDDISCPKCWFCLQPPAERKPHFDIPLLSASHMCMYIYIYRASKNPNWQRSFKRLPV